jgi:type II pantothenate kinase
VDRPVLPQPRGSRFGRALLHLTLCVETVHAAIDFGISNTDAIALVAGEWRRWTTPSDGPPDQALVERVLAQGQLRLDALNALHVTGGRHKALLPQLGACRVIPVAEVSAIGRGGVALASGAANTHITDALIVSAGSGTAVIAARDGTFTHSTGTGVGGGTLLGLGRLLLGTTDPTVIDEMALRGDPNGADLALRDVVTGPIGTLPPDATAVNFGRIAKQMAPAEPNDLAAALVTLVGQVIAVTAVNAARAERLPHIVMIGHLADMQSFRNAVALVSSYYATPITLPEHAGFGTALGAFLHK